MEVWHLSSTSPAKRPAREVISIGAFRLIPSQRLLMKGDETVKLGGRAFDILLALVDRAGDVVSQRDLIAKVWPNVFVEEVSLRFHIGVLRKALENDTTHYLTNVPGRGYGLVAPVSREATQEYGEAQSDSAPVYPLSPPPARMVGRDDEVRVICEKLLSRRFVSIVGLGGVGKTTVALAVAHALLGEFLGAVCFVDLSRIDSAPTLPATVTSAFGLPVQAQDPVPDLIADLRGKRVLLVIDSCEHLIGAAAALSERLLKETSALHILATSREALRAEGEHVHSLPPLGSPPDDGALTAAAALAYPAARLFCDRVANAGFGAVLSDEDARTVGEMCRQLGGIALAIELAAGRVAIHGIRDTASLLNSQFALQWAGRRTAPARQQTLHATLDWSYNLLPPAERAVLRRLSAFAGGFTLEAAQRVASDDLGAERVVAAVGGLAEKFLLSTDLSGPAARYRLLDTTRAYANRKLEEAGERDAVRRHHALYYCELLRATAANEVAPDRPTASASDLDEVRLALRWAFDDGGDALVGADIAAYSAPLWLGRALLAECRGWMAKAIAACRSNESVPEQQRLRIYNAFATTELFTSGFTKETVVAWTETLARAEVLGDLPSQMISYVVLWAGEIRAALYRDALATAERCAVAVKGVSDAGSLATGEWLLGHSKHHVALFAEARDHLRRYLEIDTEAARFASIKVTGYDRRVDALSVLSNVFWIVGQPDQARAWSTQAVAEARSLGFAIPVGLASLWALLNAHLMEPDVEVVEHDAVELLERSRTNSIHSDAGFALCVMGLCQATRGDFGAGVRLVSEGLRVLSEAQMEAFSALVLAHTCEAAIRADRLSDAVFWMSRLDSTDRNQDHWCSAEVSRVRGLLAQAQGDQHGAAWHFADALELARRQGALSWELRAIMSLAKLRATQRREAEALRALEDAYGRFQEGFDSADLLEAKRLIGELRAASARD
jgi:predicted ATPase/DNA-binding winged helix-turn-helix (wHTH) protein